jgi:hypothetical protein
MSSPVPSVEERLRFSLVICQALKHVALLADEVPSLVVPNLSPRDVLRLCPGVLDALVGQLAAVQAALPVEILNDDAPFVRRTR